MYKGCWKKFSVRSRWGRGSIVQLWRTDVGALTTTLWFRQDILCPFQIFRGLTYVRSCCTDARTWSALSGLYGVVRQQRRFFFPSANEYICIPYRPVLKKDPTSTNEIRLAFNCSLKTSDSPSHNEAAYQEEKLTGDLLILPFSFQANKHLLADIRRAS